LPEGFESFVSLVVPELQRRGLFQKEYRGSTYRESLGLRRPAHPSLSSSGSTSGARDLTSAPPRPRRDDTPLAL
jgi:hypothetical protein